MLVLQYEDLKDDLLELLVILVTLDRPVLSA